MKGGPILIEDTVLIAGPTASGKSAAALDLASRENRAIVNADSMQVYHGLEVLSAAPTLDERGQVPHLLYGHVEPWLNYSVGAWLRDVAASWKAGRFGDRGPIFVGGTGLYFRALLGGLAVVPPIPVEARDHWRARLSAEGADALHRELQHLDPGASAALAASDGQRIVRALEVVNTTGRSLLDWQAGGGEPLIDTSTARRLILQPDRARLVARINSRFDRMLETGAIEEARRFDEQGISPEMPAAKAIGLQELQAYISGRISLIDAAQRAKARSRQYAKRQATWFRHQMDASWIRLGEWSHNL